MDLRGRQQELGKIPERNTTDGDAGEEAFEVAFLLGREAIGR